MKEIPKIEGQKLQGTTPSVFALAFLIVGVPIISALIVNYAIYLGDEENYFSSVSRTDSLLGPFPQFRQSGDGVDSLCNSNNPLGVSDPACIATPDIADVIEHDTGSTTHGNETRRHFTMPSCTNITGGNCGSSGYIIDYNFTTRYDEQIQNKMFPIFEFNVTNEQQVACQDGFTSGASRLDYKVKFAIWEREPLFWNTSIWTFGYERESVEFSGNYRFNSSFITFKGTTFDLCRITINFQHILSFVELDEMTNLFDSFDSNRAETYGIFMTVEIDNLRTDEGYSWDSTSYYNPFEMSSTFSSDTWLFIDFKLVEVDAVNTFLKFGVFFMGVGFWAIGLASTPYWDPFIKKVKK